MNWGWTWSRWEKSYIFGACQKVGVGQSDVEFEAIGCEEAISFGVTELVSNPGSLPYCLCGPGQVTQPY